MATVRENLIAAKALIDTPEKWTRNDDGKGARSANRAAFDVAKSGPTHGYKLSVRFSMMIDALEQQLSGNERRLFLYNQRATHADVMALFDRAIAAQVQS